MADEKDIEGEEAEGGGKKKLIIIIAAVVLLIGGGAAAFFLMGGEEPVAEDGAKEAVSETAEEENAADPFYHSLGDVFVVNLPAGGKFKMMQVGINVLTKYPTVVETLEKHDPVIRHKMFDLLGRQVTTEMITRQGRENLAGEIKLALEKTLKEKGTEKSLDGIYFNQFVLQ